jgi:lipopolysaccharide/colanic/teichoic acid biosynthesis glycosyltransferase
MSVRQQFAKRTLDLTVSAVGLVALLPLLAAVAAAIRASSPGPVFFRQRRIGRGGVPFWLYKFRTMRPAPGGPSITAAGDHRITPVGRWLRHWKLDELPQLFNVLRGEMSLIGPRPEVPEYVRLYDAEQQRVLSVRPGITGPSQICFRDEERLLAAQPDPQAYYTSTLLPAKLAVDLNYLRQASIREDVRLLSRTVLAICHLTRDPGRTRKPPGENAARHVATPSGRREHEGFSS